MDNCRKIKVWDNKTISYSDWSKLNVDWINESKLDNSVPSYFFCYDNFKTNNEYIIKSVFGVKSKLDIKCEIEYWFNKCVGAYNDINIKQ